MTRVEKQRTKSENPVVVEIWRGDRVESRHRGAVAVVDGAGDTVFSLGDIHAPIYPRSSLKPVQALWLLESGAAEHFHLTSAHISLACASHSGELPHTERVTAWLEEIGLDESWLECGTHPPSNIETRVQMIREGIQPSPVHNNCSGKHCGFLSTAVHLGVDPHGYIKPDHPVQREVADIVQDVCGFSLEGATPAVDGCGIPLFAIPLRNLGFAFAGFAPCYRRTDARGKAGTEVVNSILEHPFLIAGTGRFCTRVMEFGNGKAIVKTGAEGVYLGVLLDQGLGVALKIDDGATRAAEVLMAGVLERFSSCQDFSKALQSEIERPLKNVVGKTVGKIQLSKNLLARSS